MGSEGEEKRIQVGIVRQGLFRTILVDAAQPRTVVTDGKENMTFKTMPENIPFDALNAAVARAVEEAVAREALTCAAFGGRHFSQNPSGVKAQDAIDAAIREAVEEETKALRDTLEAVETEVAKVYCHITGGRMSKCNYESGSVISEADAETDRIVQEEVREAIETTTIECQKQSNEVHQELLREAQDAVWEECARMIEDHYWDSLHQDERLKKHVEFLAIAIRARKASIEKGEGKT